MNNLLKPPVEDTQESLVQDFSLPVLGILTASAIGDPTGISAAVIPIFVREVFTPLFRRNKMENILKVLKVATPWIFRFIFDILLVVLCVAYNSHWFFILWVLVRILGVDFLFLWIRIYAHNEWSMPQFFIEKVKLWFGKFFVDAASIFPLLSFVPSDHPDSPIAFLLFLARTLGVDFVQLFIGTYRFHRILYDEDEK